MRFLSCGYGVQSTTLGEMSAQGIIDPLDAVISSDTQWERKATYEIRDFYMARWQKMGMRVETVTAGDVRKLGSEPHIHIPFWTSDGGPLQRQCTRHFKITPVKRKIRQLLGYHESKPPHPKHGAAEVWLGISLDEWARAKPDRVKFLHNRWPLLEMKMDRQDCIDWLTARDLPVPVKSACIGCPYRRASEWIEMRDDAPDEFAAAVAFDEENRYNPLAERANSSADALYIYTSRGSKPEALSTAMLEIDASSERRQYGTQLPFTFCESGYCWV